MKKNTLLMPLVFCSFIVHANNLRKETNEYYNGVINGKYEIKMVLSRDSGICSGSYYYTTYKKPIFLYGACNSSNFDLQEQEKMLGYREKDNKSVIIGIIKNNAMLGSWHSYDNKKTYSFEAKKITPDKKEILKDSIGDYAIYRISSFYGANTIADIFNDNGKWNASYSSISGGERSESDRKLSRDDIYMLTSFKLTVDSSLDVKIYSKDRIIADFPFFPGSFFQVKNITKEEDEKNNIGRIFKYKGIGNFFENELHIATTDKFDFVSHLPLDEPTNEDYVASLNYNPLTMQFEVNIVGTRCCDSTTLYLKKFN